MSADEAPLLKSSSESIGRSLTRVWGVVGRSALAGSLTWACHVLAPFWTGSAGSSRVAAVVVEGTTLALSMLSLAVGFSSFRLRLLGGVLNVCQ